MTDLIEKDLLNSNVLSHFDFIIKNRILEQKF